MMKKTPQCTLKEAKIPAWLSNARDKLCVVVVCDKPFPGETEHRHRFTPARKSIRVQIASEYNAQSVKRLPLKA